MTADCSATVTDPSPSAHSGRPVIMMKRAPGYPPGAAIAVHQRVCRCRHEATSPSAAWLSCADRYDSQVRGQRVGAAQGGCLGTLRVRAVRSRKGACYQREPQADWTSACAKLTDPSQHRYDRLACTKNVRGPRLIHSGPACSQQFPLLIIAIRDQSANSITLRSC